MKALTLLLAIAGSAPAEPAPKAELMIVGTPHFDNPGRDMVNTHIDDVLTPQRQNEIAAVVDALARFRPTHVAVEWPASAQAALDKRYADYRAGKYTLSRDERDQIGLRLAAKLGLPRVDAVDWNDEPPGEDADYDFPAWLAAHDRAAEWEAFRKRGQAEADRKAADNRCHAVADWIRALASPEGLRGTAKPYFTIARFGDNQDNPGAAWVGTWYARNLRIFANLLAVGGKPGERTVAVFGAGHAPLLRHDADWSGQFRIVEPGGFLPKAVPSRCPADK